MLQVSVASQVVATDRADVRDAAHEFSKGAHRDFGVADGGLAVATGAGVEAIAGKL